MQYEFTIAELKDVLEGLPEHYPVHFEIDDETVIQLRDVEIDPLFMVVDFLFQKVDNGSEA